ncbi:MAG TPA: dynamin family protein [Vicinamibacterales bacterium]|nr:dynamin family protein [Vicinamibacterales bacterium]
MRQPGGMLRAIATSAEDQLRHARELLASVRDALTEFGATEADRSTLAASIRQIEELFLLVVVGEFNAGKSAFINALIGQRVLEEGVTPTTAHIHVLQYGDTVGRYTGDGGLQVITAPVDLLRELHIVDTPGTNAILREHERLTTDFVPRSDLVLFLTSADRPFTESERSFLASIKEWGKKIVVVVNKIDILATPREQDEVLTFVRDHARTLLGTSVEVFPASARLAMRAKHGEPPLWTTSGFDTLERYLDATLDTGNRFKLKLANPLGVGQALAGRYASIADERLTLLQEDLAVLGDVDRQLAVHRDDMRRGFDLRMTAIEKVLGDMEARGMRYFENTLRIGRVVDLMNRARVQKEFEEEVVANAPAEIERRVNELIDWLVDQDFRQWQAVTARLADRRRDHAARVLGAPDVGSFHNDRSRLIESVGREAARVVETYDRRRESEAIADQARIAVAASAAAGGAAVGLGTLVTVAASTVAADVTGILLASLVLGIGFLIIPARRRRAKAVLQEKISALRERLATTLRGEFDRAQEQSHRRLAEASAPYARFVRSEEQRWSGARRRLGDVQTQLAALLREISAAG